MEFRKKDIEVFDQNVLFADFETLTQNEYYQKQGFTEILYYVVKDINYKIIAEGTNGLSFLKFLESYKSSTFYFHNLSFDGDFIEKILFNNGYQFINNFDNLDREKINKSFRSIKVNNKIYQINMQIGKKKIHNFLCSKNLLSSSIEKLGEDFGLNKKNKFMLEMGYKKFIEYASPKTKYSKEEFDIEYWKEYINYCRRDVDIMIMSYSAFANTLKSQKFLEYDYINKFSKLKFKRHLKISSMLTIGQLVFKIMVNAISNEKDKKIRIKKRDLYIDYRFYEENRKIVKGGLTQLSPKYFNKEINEDIIALDINSSYPFQMTKLLPISELIPEGDEYIAESENIEKINYVKFNVLFGKIKPKYQNYPFFKNNDLKNNLFRYFSSKDIIIDTEFILLKEEFDLINKIYDLEIDNQVNYFAYAKKYFKNIVENLYQLKLNSVNEGEKFSYKTMLNALFGKLLQKVDRNEALYMNDEILNALLEKNENLVIKDNYFNDQLYKIVSNAISKTGNIANEINHIKIKKILKSTKPILNPLIGGTITAYARVQLIENILKLPEDKFIYCDTDSIFFIKYDNWEKDFDLDLKKLGSWKIDGEFVKGKVIGAKKYIFDFASGKQKIASSGIDIRNISKEKVEELFYSNVSNKVTIENSCLIKNYDKNGISFSYKTKDFEIKEKY